MINQNKNKKLTSQIKYRDNIHVKYTHQNKITNRN